MSDEQACGLYSETAAEKYGTVIWANGDGKMFEITAYDYPSTYKWPDAVVVTTEPITYCKQGQPGSQQYRFEPPIWSYFR